MGSAHSDAAEIVASEMRSTPAGAERIAMAYEFRMNSRNQAMCEVLGQGPSSGWTDGQLWDLSGLLEFLFEGSVRLFRVSIGAEPVRDRFRAKNQAALRAGLPEGCTADVWGAERDESRSVEPFDGIVAFSTGVKYRSWELYGNEPLDLDLGTYGDLPLEIGRTDATRTYSHLAEDGAVARWPYNHGVLAVLVAVPRWRLAKRVDNAFHRKLQEAQLSE
jgi:hypothetical protein